MILFRLYTPQGFGYYDKKAAHHRFPFFGAGNLAFRRECLTQVGAFDPRLLLGEDTDLTMRVLSSKWEIFSMDRAVNRHRVTYGFGVFAKKWFWHGYYLAQIYQKHHRAALEIFRRRKPARAGKSAFDCVFYSVRFPLRAIVFVDSFYLAHLCALAAWLTRAEEEWCTGFLVAAVLAFARYAREDFSRRGLTGVLRSLALRYVWNVTQIAGGIYGGLVHRMFVLNATV